MTSLTFLIIGNFILNSVCVLSVSNRRAIDKYYYSDTFTEADEQFTLACRDARGSIEYFNHPDKGAQNEALRAAVCAVGKPQDRSIVYTISGTHGIEGFAGSMAQISMLRGSSSMYPEGVRMVHLHMINPYGASFILKENEQNADQLKNYAGYYALNYTNEIVEELMDGIDLPHAGNETVRNNSILHFNHIIAKYGPDRVSSALSMGQGKRPQGIAYFGPNKSWSSNTSDYVINKYLNNAEQVLVIDWHTAVGPYGEWTFLPMDPESKTRFQRWAPKTLIDVYDVGVPPGGELPYGKIKAISGAKRVIRGPWEAGTYPVDMNINAAFILRLYCRFYSNSSDPFCQYIIGQIQNYFYPQLTDWKAKTFNAINDVLPTVLSGFAADANNAVMTSNSILLVLSALILLYIR